MDCFNKFILMNRIFAALFICNMIAAPVNAQAQKANVQLPIAGQPDTVQIRLYNEASEYYFQTFYFDSCKEYALLALHKLAYNYPALTIQSTHPVYLKKLKAKALENYGCSLTYENTPAGKDSLNTALLWWKKLQDPPGLATCYLRIAELYMNQSKYEIALAFFDSSLSLFQSINNKQGQALVYYEKALTLRYMARHGDALETNAKAIYLAKEINNNDLAFQCLLSNGFIYMSVRDYSKALQIQQEALAIAQQMKNADFISTVYSDMGVTNMRTKNLEEALSNHRQALDIRKQNKLYGNISSTYNYISEVLMEQKKYSEALTYSLEGLKYAKTQGDGRYLMDAYFYTAASLANLQQHSKAILYYDTLQQMAAKMNVRYYQSMACYGKAELYSMQHNYPYAVKWLTEGIAVTDSTDYKTLLQFYNNLSKAHFNTGNYKMAYLSSQNLYRYYDAVAKMEKAEKIRGLTIQMDFENRKALLKASQDKQLAKKQSQIEKQKLIKNISIAGLILVIGLAALFFIRYTEKQRLNSKLEDTLSHLKSTQTQLIHAEKMASLGELTAGIAHEIQNPLNFITNFSEVNSEMAEEATVEIKKGNYTEAENILQDIKENAQKIIHHGKRADGIIKGMLQHSRSSTGQKEPTDINALCDEFLRLSYHGLRAKDKSFNAKFETDFDAALPKINVVPQDIGRVILNLINNAFFAVNDKKKSADENYEPTVFVKTSKIPPSGSRAAAVEIVVKDNGVGIPKSIKDKIFQPFFTTKASGQGTGLGLSISYDIITKLHGGNITIQSSSAEDDVAVPPENTGTSFIITLPV